MKRYTFRLARVLRVRRLQEEILRAAFFEARANADAALAVKQAHAIELERGRDTLVQLQQASPLSPARVIAQQDLLLRLESVLERLASEHEKLEAEAERRADAAREVRAGVRGLERLDERRRRAHAATVEQSEQAQADESAARRSASEPALGALLTISSATRGGSSPWRATADEASSSVSGPLSGPQQVPA